MNANEMNIVDLWLKKARNDLASAKKLSSGNNKILDTAIYHCQQAAEKAIKAYLISIGINFIKTHDIVYLVKLGIDQNPELTFLLDLAELLTPYAVEYRYPDDILEPDYEEFEEALSASAIFIEKIQNMINDKEL
jgi:HEPN domain-containing protein